LRSRALARSSRHCIRNQRRSCRTLFGFPCASACIIMPALAIRSKTLNELRRFARLLLARSSGSENSASRSSRRIPEWPAAQTCNRCSLRVLTGRLRLLNRLPAIYGLREYVDAGGLIAYGVNLAELFRPRRSAPIFRRCLLLGPKVSSNSDAFCGAA
jgi:hypothetical protein